MLSKRIADERKKLGLNQEELAEKVGVSQKSISKYENGTRRPTYETLSAMADLFGVSERYLIRGISETDLEWKFDCVENRFGNILMEYRRHNGLSVEDFADKLGIGVKTYSGFEVGTYMPSLKLIKKISDVTNLDIDYLTGAIKGTSVSTEKTVSFNGYQVPISHSYSDFTFLSRFESLCLKNGISQENCEDEFCFSKEDFIDIKYNRMPTLSELLKISYAFNVSLDFLIGRKDESEEKILEAFCLLNDDNKDIIIGDIKKYIKEQKYEESVAADEQLPRTGTTNSAK